MIANIVRSDSAGLRAFFISHGVPVGKAEFIPINREWIFPPERTLMKATVLFFSVDWKSLSELPRGKPIMDELIALKRQSKLVRYILIMNTDGEARVYYPLNHEHFDVWTMEHLWNRRTLQ